MINVPSSRRVVITGMGVISPLGNSIESVWSGLTSGRSGVIKLAASDDPSVAFACAGLASEFRGKIDDFGPLDPATKKLIRKGLKLMCREIQMGVASAQWSLHHAGIERGMYASERMGVVFGCDHIVSLPDEFHAAVASCTDERHAFHFEHWGKQGLSEITPLWLLKYLPNMPASHIAIYNDLRGPNNSLTYREASSNIALGEAAATIRRGGADCVLAGATGSSVAPLRAVQLALHAQWACPNGEPAAETSRPFDARRTGMVAAEGAGTLVLEEFGAAQARGATIYGEVLGCGSSTVVDQNSVADNRQALVNAMRAALDQSRIPTSELGHIHAHGAATRQGDLEEARAIHDVFAARPKPVPVVAAKSYMGNLGAAGGMVEIISSLLAIERGELFPILNCQEPDPTCPIELATARTNPGGSFLNLNFTPQGQASAVLISQLSNC